MFSIDGISWDVPCKVTRTAELKASDVSGLMLNKVFYNDVIGTYYKYKVVIVVPSGMEGEYSTLYEVLTKPVAYHTFVLPYNQDTITLVGRVEISEDTLYRVNNSKNYWEGLTVTIIATSPTKTNSLGQAITAGLPPYPDTAYAEIGDLYQYTGTGWVPVYYEDADEEYF